MVRRERRNPRGRTFSALHLTNTTPIDLHGKWAPESTPVSRNAGTKEVERSNVSDSLHVNVANIPVNLDGGGTVVNTLSTQIESEVMGKLQGLFQTITSRVDRLERNNRRNYNFGEVRFAYEFGSDWRGQCNTQHVLQGSIDEMIPRYDFGNMGRNDDFVAFGTRSEIPDSVVINPHKITTVHIMNILFNVPPGIDISILKYSGAHKKKTPYDFVIELEKYQRAADPATPQHTRVDKVMENMHLEYRHKILGRRQNYATIKELLDQAYEALASIAWDREFKVPDIKPGVEPT
ncbi:unnamed protein product [Allacma fusca]|uniref:Uncharacterized protein n=1 Tax=Allacma fusca TaxID=39272 RepID=A0A8J2L436_9HEXA|nr:unnamed protein product [Allacma fusca]